MLTPRGVSWLRRAGVWAPLKKLHGAIAPSVCALIHGAICRLPGGLVSTDLALKHVYDYRLVHVHPERIRYALPVGNWRRGRSAAGGPGRWAELKRWRTHGGAWKSLNRHVSRNLHGRFVLDGNWDANRRPFEIRPTIMELFVQGVPIHRTTEYRKMRRWVEAGDFRYTRGCRSIADVGRYFADLHRTFESIQRDGFRTQEDLGAPGGDEIRVAIGHDGELCIYGGGTHRLSIARVLRLDRVPVLVKRVHAEWVATCVVRYGGPASNAIHQGIGALEDRNVAERESVAGATPRRPGEARC